MSEPENFLSRWSRRKLEGVERDGRPRDRRRHRRRETRSSAIRKRPRRALTRPSCQAQDEEPAFDPANLPLARIRSDPNRHPRFPADPGVPVALSRAALRRAWSTDPAIRDFIGLAENQWDFTATNSIPGFGPLDPAEVPRLLAKIISSNWRHRPDRKLEAETEAPEPAQAPQNAAGNGIGVRMHRGNVSADPGRRTASEPLEPSATNEHGGADARSAATQMLRAKRGADGKSRMPHVRHGHGGALPRIVASGSAAKPSP